MNCLYTIVSVICLSISATAITNVKHSLGCENERVTLSCPDGKVIDVLDGNYGRSSESVCTKGPIKTVSCHQEDTVSIVTDLCEGRTECTIDANNKVFGDPCVGTVKYLFVLYHCVNVQEFKVGLACEHKPLQLECEPGKVIQVHEANYGRRSQITCADGPIKTTNCRTDHAADIVSGLCSLKRTCLIMATNNIFGDPCLGTYKYLSVKYKCVPGSDDCCSKSTPRPVEQCVDGSIILPSFICDGKRDCPHGDDELMCSYETKSTCENGKLEIKCRKGETIKIVNANYGRTSAKVCAQNDITVDINCRAGNSRQILEENCNGRQKCEIKASNKIFGDPCHGIVKYLEVQYECEPGAGSHIIIPRSLNN